MDQYAGIDVSLEASHLCVVDGQGKVTKEAKLASERARCVDRLVCQLRRADSADRA